MSILEKLQSFSKNHILGSITQYIQEYNVEVGYNAYMYVGDLAFRDKIIQSVDDIISGCDLKFEITDIDISDDEIKVKTMIDGTTFLAYNFTFSFLPEGEVKLNISEQPLSYLDSEEHKSPMNRDKSYPPHMVAKYVEKLTNIVESDDFNLHCQRLHCLIGQRFGYDFPASTETDIQWLIGQMSDLVTLLYFADPSHINLRFFNDYHIRANVNPDFKFCVFAEYDSDVGTLFLKLKYDSIGVYITVDNEPMSIPEREDYDSFNSENRDKITNILVNNDEYLSEHNPLSILIHKTVNFNLDIGEHGGVKDVFVYRDTSLLYFYFKMRDVEAFVCVHNDTKFIMNAGYVNPYWGVTQDSKENWSHILNELHRKLLNAV